MHVVRRPGAQLDSCRDVAITGNGLWSLYGAERSQPVATGGKWSVSENREIKRKPLRSIATGCPRCSMARVHPL
jgi:hypothetical protein